MGIDNEEIIKELERLNGLAWEIQGQLNIINDAKIKIGGDLLHNLQNGIDILQDQLEKKAKITYEQQETPCCYDD
jgi:hypothetical protein